MRRVQMWAVTAGVMVLFGSGGCPAQADEAARVDVPIAQTVLPNGDTRYSVPVSIGGGSPINASLDTGSFGLRVLSQAVDPARYEATEMERHYPFGGGARFNGVLARSRITVGDAGTSGPILFQLIKSVDCVPQKPKCPASRLDAKDYRIAGDGYAGLGFDAIIGLSLRKAPGPAGADNPLGLIGDGRWIVVLPRPGQALPGHLIINPGPDETAGFTTFRLSPQPSNGASVPGWKDTDLSGCLVNGTSKERTCAPTLFDSGAPGIQFNSTQASRPTAWPDGTAATLQIGGGDKPVEISFTVGQDAATRVHIVPGQSATDRLSAGSLPFFSYAILYDQKNGLMGMKARGDD